MNINGEGSMIGTDRIADGRSPPRRAPRRTGFVSGLPGSRKRLVALFLAGTVVAVLATTFVASDRSYANPNREGGGCDGCHSGAQTASMLTVTGLPVGTYEPSQQYTITITITDSNGGTGENNFDIIANLGTFSTTDPNAEINAPASGAEASANDDVSPMTATTWTVVWTAPASGDAQIDIWAVMGDGAGGTLDIWDHESYTYGVIPEFSVLLVPVIGVVVAVILASRVMRR